MKNKSFKNILILFGVIVSASLTGILLSMLFLPFDDLPDMPLAPGSFDIPGDEIGNFTLGVGWQMVSMPNNINKTNVYINYGVDSYLWDDAVSEGLIANVVMEYSTDGYVETNYLLKTRGYWIYCWVDGIQISDEAFTMYCANIYTGYENMSNITCNRVVVSPEFYDNDIYCNTFTATDSFSFYFNGGEVLE